MKIKMETQCWPVFKFKQHSLISSFIFETMYIRSRQPFLWKQTDDFLGLNVVSI